jgi:ZIP family zinc transporter
MLPTSKGYLVHAGYSASAAAYILMGLFLAGVIGIQTFSAFLHRHIPSHIVDCRHTHEHEHKDMENGNAEVDRHQHSHFLPNEQMLNAGFTEHSPLLSQATLVAHPSDLLFSARSDEPTRQVLTTAASSPLPRPTLWSRFSGPINLLLVGQKAYCDESGPCYGLSQACGQECTKTRPRKGGPCSSEAMGGHYQTIGGKVVERLSANVDQEVAISFLSVSSPQGENISDAQATPQVDETHREDCHALDSSHEDHHHSTSSSATAFRSPDTSQAARQHHHHVPKNAFLSIGLQTSLAIALHKLPEGFITYATNHANPTLGFSVFIALFIHNITEGFAMALPLYLALNSRLKAILWSSLLGGISQPAGAGIAALWIWGAEKVTGQSDGGPAETGGVPFVVYGGMFAVTAGVMTSVALQLFSEGLELTHNRTLCIGFAVTGMGILGLSYALTA